LIDIPDVVVVTFLNGAALKLQRLRAGLVISNFISGILPRFLFWILAGQFICIENGRIFRLVRLFMTMLYLAVDV
jgi:hypothetical protein